MRAHIAVATGLVDLDLDEGRGRVDAMCRGLDCFPRRNVVVFYNVMCLFVSAVQGLVMFPLLNPTPLPRRVAVRRPEIGEQVPTQTHLFAHAT